MYCIFEVKSASKNPIQQQCLTKPFPTSRHNIHKIIKISSLSSLRQRCRTVGGVIQSITEGLKPRGPDDINSRARREDEMRCPSSSAEAEKMGHVPPSSFFSFYPGLQWDDKLHSLWGGLSTLLSSQTQMLITSGNNLSNTHRNNI